MATETNTMATSQNLLKAVFSSAIPKDAIQDAGATFFTIPQTPAGGDSFAWDLRDSYAQSRGNTMEKAYASATTQQVLRFTLPSGDAAYPEQNFAGQFSNKLLASAMGAPNRYAFDNMMSIVNGSRTQHFMDMSMYLWGDGSGALATVASVTSTTVTLTLYTDAVRFFPRATYVSSSTKYSTEPTNSAVLSGVDVNYATKVAVLTFETAVPSGIAQGDFLFAYGMYATAIATGVPLGIPSYIVPGDISVSTPFLGVTRSLNRNMTAGFSQDCSTGSFSENLTSLVYSMSMYGQRGRTIVMHDKIMQQLQLEQGGSIIRETTDQSGLSLLGFNKWRATFMGAGTFDIITDKFCPGNQSFIIDPNAFEVQYLAMCDMNPSYWASGLGLNGGTIHPDIPLTIIPGTSKVAYQGYSYYQLICNKPSVCGVMYNLVP